MTWETVGIKTETVTTYNRSSMHSQRRYKLFNIILYFVNSITKMCEGGEPSDGVLQL